MSKPETTFYRAVHAHLPKTLHHEKMHNAYAGGTWDVWYSGLKADLWVEYKYVVLPKRPATPVSTNLSELQKAWGRERYLEGRNIAVIVGAGSGRTAGGIILTGCEWEEPLTCQQFQARLLSRLEIAAWIVQQTS